MIIETEDLLCLPNRHFKSKGEGAAKRLHKVDMTCLAQFCISFMLDIVAPNSHKLDIHLKIA